MQQIQLYRSFPAACNYIPGNDTINLIIDPELTLSAAKYEELLAQGFRRSGNMMYRPDCEHCSACIPTRIPVNEFKPRRNQRRCLKSNHDLSMKVSAASFTREHYQLYQRYLASQHSGGGMDNPTEQTFTDFLCQRSDMALFLEFRNDTGELLCVACTDRLPGSLSAVYTWYAPEEKQRGLGVLAILKQIQLSQELELDHLYLGYWIETSPKMSYKTDYQPYELYQDHQWKSQA